MSDIFDYSPASRFPGSDSHVELHGPAHGSDHNSNGLPMYGPPTDSEVHAGSDPSSW